jgi:hypothetical protein
MEVGRWKLEVQAGKRKLEMQDEGWKLKDGRQEMEVERCELEDSRREKGEEWDMEVERCKLGYASWGMRAE